MTNKFKPYQLDNEADDRDKLIAVLDYLRDLIYELIAEGRSYLNNELSIKFFSRVVDAKVLSGIINAWSIIETRIDEIKKSINEMKSEDAEKHGLTGLELNMKLHALAWASEELHRTWQNTIKEISPRKEKRILGILKKNIDIIDTVVGSIIEATKIGVALKEIIRVISDCFKDFNKR